MDQNLPLTWKTSTRSHGPLSIEQTHSSKQHRVDDERFGGLVYKLPGVAVRDCRRKRIRDKVSVFVRQRPSAAIPEMTQLRLTGRVLLSPYAVDDLGFTIVADGVESASAGTNTGRHSNE